MTTITDRQLDELVAELLPVLRGSRDAAEFLFDPVALNGRTLRTYYQDYLDWLGLPHAILPPERVYIHDNRPDPAYLEYRQLQGAAAGKFSLYLNIRLFRSSEALKMALAHEFTHLYLMVNGLQAPTKGSKSLEQDEEIRTDVASVVLGFGTAVVNGATAFQRMAAAEGAIGQLGYLSVDQFQHVHQRVKDLVGVR